ncbi:MAG TPA: SMP-30/gluconolactonase/LRE family protein [Acidimicrobiales bacterium]
MREYVAEPCTTDLYYLGESCRWDEVRGELYWVDLDAGKFYRATADSSRVEIVATYEVDGTLTAVAPMRERSEGWIVATDQSISILGEDGHLRELDRPEAPRASRVRMNDGAVDPWGRFWIGSMAYDAEPGLGSLYRYGDTTGTEMILQGLTISNGLGWSPDRHTMYFIDSGPSVVYAFDVDDEGNVNDQRTLIQLDHESEGDPDGMCVDAEGALWIAVWGGYEVRRYSPNGELIARVALSTAQPACCAIGGSNGRTLYITTAREDMAFEQLAQEPDAGRLFCVDVGVTALPLNAFGAS